jgi:hypothetical protein
MLWPLYFNERVLLHIRKVVLWPAELTWNGWRTKQSTT